MALTPRSGSLVTPSTPNDVPNNIPNSQSDVLPHIPFISDSNLNKFAIDTTQYVDVTKSLVGFMKGKRVLVTYYRLLNREGINNRTNIADLPTERNVLHSEYQKIINLEITLPKAFEFTANNAQANMSIKGEAQFYPNMNPNIADIFLMGTGDGRIGFCRITSVTPMSWRTDRTYIVDFLIQEFVTPEISAVLEAAVTTTSVFSKENYLGGTAALLSEQTYLQLIKIKELRSNLCRLYHQKFFDKNLCSYLSPEGFYDPWVVQFMANKITMDDIPIRPKNLLGQKPEIYNKTLWGRLEDRFNNNLYFISPRVVVVGSYEQTRMGAFVTELFGKQVLYPTDDDTLGDPYIYTTAFYSGTNVNMTPEELRVYKAITLRDAGDLTTLIVDYLDLVFTLNDIEQFYKIPLYIHLIDMSLQSQYRQIDAPSMGYANNSDE